MADFADSKIHAWTADDADEHPKQTAACLAPAEPTSLLRRRCRHPATAWVWDFVIYAGLEAALCYTYTNLERSGRGSSKRSGLASKDNTNGRLPDCG
jgi:hypothetical protein